MVAKRTRAVVYIKKHDPKSLRETVLHACTHNLTYDPQCEGDRETYLLDLIHACDDEKFFRKRLLEALTTAPRSGHVRPRTDNRVVPQFRREG